MPINYLKSIQLGEFNEDGYKIWPSEDIDTIVEGFYIFSRAAENHSDLIFNDGYPVLIFLRSREDSISVNTENDVFNIKGAWASAGSIKNVYINYSSQADQLFIVRFYPNAFYQLFGLTPEYFRSRPLASLQSIIKHGNFGIDDFFECSNIPEKVTFVETFVRNSYSGTEAPEILNETMAYIRKIKGKSSVREVADYSGVNYKWLERSFVRYIGLLPKSYLQLQRFIHAYIEMTDEDNVDLMRIAVSNGYYDSNHFLKDFKAYTGKTPLEYLRLSDQVLR